VPPLAVLDIDGTLADTNYHQAIAWYRASRQQDLTYPLWQIHRRMGMGGQKLVADLAGDNVEREQGDAVSAAEKPLYLELIHEVAAIPGARELGEAGAACVFESLEDLRAGLDETPLASA